MNNIAVILDYGLTSVLLFMAAKSFKRVLTADDYQLKFVMQACCQSACFPAFLAKLVHISRLFAPRMSASGGLTVVAQHPIPGRIQPRKEPVDWIVV